MTEIARTIRQHKGQIAVVAALALSSAACTAMIAVRVLYTGRLHHVFLVWNLFLAWVPMVCAVAAYVLYARKSVVSYLAILPCAGIWLLFFPNAPYVMTDLIHLQPFDETLIWFDLVMILFFGWTALFLGFASLYLMQDLVSRTLGNFAGWLFVFATFGLSGFGVYLGRIRGWNSWDVFYHPGSLLSDIWDRLRHPLAHQRTFAFSLLFAVFFLSAYFILFAFARLRPAAHEAS